MSDGPTLGQMIELLVSRRYPALVAMKLLSKLSQSGDKYLYSGKIAEAETYETALRSKSLAEIQALYAEAAAQPAQAATLPSKVDLEEQRRFFNQPQANADFDHWTKTAHWTLDEAVALSFGKAPEVVRWENVKYYSQVSPFAAQYARVRDLTLRAVPWKQLYDPILPSLFLAWAKRTDVSYPPELERRLLARGHQIADWKTHYDSAREEVDKARTENERAKAEMAAFREAVAGVIAGKDELIATQVRELAELRSTQEAAAKEAATAPAPERPMGRERESLLKLVIGMAVGGYRFDPSAGRSDVIPEISSDLERAGVPLDPDTVRRWVREGAVLLPPEALKDRNS